MGVYLSEINMPKGEGSKLVLQIFPNGEVYDGQGFRLGIANWAEAVPVPPHGRLGDLDALFLAMFQCPDGSIIGDKDIDGWPHEARYADIKRFIRQAPTIIPPEGDTP